MPKLCFFDDFHPESDGGKRNEHTSKWGKKHIFLSILSLKTLPFKQKYVSLVALFLDIFFLHCASMTDSQTANSERQKVSELFLLLFFLFFRSSYIATSTNVLFSLLLPGNNLPFWGSMPSHSTHLPLAEKEKFNRSYHFCSFLQMCWSLF